MFLVFPGGALGCGIAAWWTGGARRAELLSIIIAQSCVEQLHPAHPSPLRNRIARAFTQERGGFASNQAQTISVCRNQRTCFT